MAGRPSRLGVPGAAGGQQLVAHSSMRIGTRCSAKYLMTACCSTAGHKAQVGQMDCHVAGCGGHQLDT